MPRAIGKYPEGASKNSSLPVPDLHRHAMRVHLELLDQFIALTKRARDEESNGFLSDSLDDQIEWLSELKSDYGR